jgi:hypothetical protein
VEGGCNPGEDSGAPAFWKPRALVGHRSARLPRWRRWGQSARSLEMDRFVGYLRLSAFCRAGAIGGLVGLCTGILAPALRRSCRHLRDRRQSARPAGTAELLRDIEMMIRGSPRSPDHSRNSSATDAPSLPADDHDHSGPAHRSACIIHHGSTDTVGVAQAGPNSRVLRLARAFMGEIAAVQAAQGHAELPVIGQHAGITVEQVLRSGRGHSRGNTTRASAAALIEARAFMKRPLGSTTRTSRVCSFQARRAYQRLVGIDQMIRGATASRVDRTTFGRSQYC